MTRGVLLPTADQLARAFVLAAETYGELDTLRKWPLYAVLAGSLRSSWAVGFALCAARPGIALVDVARLCGLPANLEAADLNNRALEPSWDWPILFPLFEALAP